MNPISLYTDPQRAEDMLPSLSYRELVRDLGPLTAAGVVSTENPATMLVVARLVDRGRIVRSGMTAAELRMALQAYRTGVGWKPVHAVARALEQAATTLENEAQSAAHCAR